MVLFPEMDMCRKVLTTQIEGGELKTSGTASQSRFNKTLRGENMEKETQNKGKSVCRILITDIAGVLNDSKHDKYKINKFDADKVQQLMRIVKETGCDIMIAPSLPDSPKMISARDRITFGCEVAGNLLSSILGVRVISPDWSWYEYSPIDAAFATVSQWMAEKDHETTYCILRAYDTGAQEWACTFGTRLVRAVSSCEESNKLGNGREIVQVSKSIGLNESVANEVIEMLKTPVLQEEIPLKVYRLEDVKDALDKIRMIPKEMNVEPRVLAETIRKQV